MSDKNKSAKITASEKMGAPAQSSSDSSAAGAGAVSARNQAFSRIKTDLSSALQQWEELSAQTPALSPEELRFQEMQQLLKELHEKMKALDFI